MRVNCPWCGEEVTLYGEICPACMHEVLPEHLHDNEEDSEPNPGE